MLQRPGATSIHWLIQWKGRECTTIYGAFPSLEILDLSLDLVLFFRVLGYLPQFTIIDPSLYDE